MTHSILDRISEKNIKRDPLSRAIIENALPDGYYQELAQTFPSLTNVVGTSELKNNSTYRTMAIKALEDATLPQIWREFIAYHCSAEFYQRLIDIWGAAPRDPVVRAIVLWPASDGGPRRPSRARSGPSQTHGLMKAGDSLGSGP